MKTSILAALVLPFLANPGPAFAQPPAPPPGEAVPDDAIPIVDLISVVAEKTGKNFILDPRVRARVLLIGQDPSQVDYDGLLAILEVHGYATVESGNYVRVVPDAVARSLPTPVVSGDEHYADGEYVSKVIPVKTLMAPQLVPVLRPILPQQAHLAAGVCSNSLIVVDTFANVRRLEALIEALDRGPEPYVPADWECRPGPPPGASGEDRSSRSPSERARDRDR